jgi:hypothetical protein
MSEHVIIGETPTEARQTEPGPSVIALLPIGDLAVMALVFFGLRSFADKENPPGQTGG